MKPQNSVVMHVYVFVFGL